jgi:hypothetical protein
VVRVELPGRTPGFAFAARCRLPGTRPGFAFAAWMRAFCIGCLSFVLIALVAFLCIGSDVRQRRGRPSAVACLGVAFVWLRGDETNHVEVFCLSFV